MVTKQSMCFVTVRWDDGDETTAEQRAFEMSTKFEQPTLSSPNDWHHDTLTASKPRSAAATVVCPFRSMCGKPGHGYRGCCPETTRRDSMIEWEWK